MGMFLLLAVLCQIILAAELSRKLSLSQLATFNIPVFVEGLRGSTKFLALTMPTRFYHYTGIPLVNEVVAHLDSKKGILKVQVHNNGFLTVYRPEVGPLEPVRLPKGQGVYFEVEEDDIVVMISTWGTALELDSGDMLRECLEANRFPVGIGEQFLRSLPDCGLLSFILARVCGAKDARMTYTRLVQKHESTSSDSFEGPSPLQTRPTFQSERKESLVLQWSSEEDFGETFLPRTDGTPDTEIGSEDEILSDSSSPNPFRTTRKKSCSIQ